VSITSGPSRRSRDIGVLPWVGMGRTEDSASCNR
jgi:hypothetical protein